MSVACILVQDRRCLSRIARSVYASISFITRVITAAGHASVIEFISGLLYVLDWNQKANTSEIFPLRRWNFERFLSLKSSAKKLLKLDVSIREIKERERWIYFISVLLRFLCFSLSRSASNSTRSNHLGNSNRSINTPTLRSFYFSSIDFDLVVISILDHPERATFAISIVKRDYEWSKRYIKMYNGQGFKMSSKKKGRLAKTPGTVQYSPTLILVRSTCSY